MSRRGLLAALCGLLALPAPAVALDVRELRVRLATLSDRLSERSSAYVRDLDTGQTLYARKAGAWRIPASNEKLLVTAAALLAHGPAGRITTALLGAALPDESGVLDGDVALVGAGDPYLSSARLRVLARRLDELGVTRIRGRVLGDGSVFDERRGSYDSGWLYDSDLHGSLGGLVLDGGRGADPGLHAAERLRAVLRRTGIAVTGRAASGPLDGEAVVLTQIESVTMSAVAQRINGPSDNFAAEMLLKELGAQFGTGGTTPAGVDVVDATLGALGVEARMADGSGLSRVNRVRARELVDLLDAMAGDAGSEAFWLSLPRAGLDGTLADRMEGTAAEGDCRAKTGSLSDVSALSGYCVTAGGSLVAFSLLENGMSTVAAKRVEDRMVAAIARYEG